MPFARQTLAELIDRVRNDLRGRLEIDGPLLRRAMADALGAVWGGVQHMLYGYIDWAVDQLFGDTAAREALLRRAKPYGITPIAATFASGNVTAIGSDGSPIDVDTILRLDATTSYRVTAGQVIDVSGLATLPVIAVLAGSAGNVDEGIELTFESPVAGVNSIATVATGGLAGGEEEEDIEEVRDRYLLRLREPPEGGADQDYEAWALEVPGVTREWTFAHELGLGTVVVRFVKDGDPDIIPDVGSVADMQEKLEEERPITAEVTALAPTELEVDFTIHVVPDNADTRAAVEAELADLLRRVAEPGDGVARGTVLISQIRTAIGVAAGVTDYTLTVPSANLVPGVGELLVTGGFSWV